MNWGERIDRSPVGNKKGLTPWGSWLLPPLRWPWYSTPAPLVATSGTRVRLDPFGMPSPMQLSPLQHHHRGVLTIDLILAVAKKSYPLPGQTTSRGLGQHQAPKEAHPAAAPMLMGVFQKYQDMLKRAHLDVPGPRARQAPVNNTPLQAQRCITG